MLRNRSRINFYIQEEQAICEYSDSFGIHGLEQKQGDFTELSGTRVFPSSDSVECFDYCKINQRLVATSHFGLVKMFRFDGGKLNSLQASLKLIWA